MSSQLAATLAPHRVARSLPRAAFVDPVSLALDAETLFRDRWIAVGHADDLDKPGAWVRAASPERGDLAVVRTAELELTLLSRICRHRGVPLLAGDGGHLPRLELVCPYHGWTYDLGGALRRAPGLPACARQEDLSLHAGFVATRGPLVFARPDTSADPSNPPPPPTLPPWLERADLAMLRRAHESAHVVAANWKLCVGNFQESHHFPHVHPALEARTPFRSSSSVLPTQSDESATWLGGIMELSEGLETVSGSGQRDGRLFVAAPQDRRLVHDAWIAPNLLTSLQPDYLLSYRLEPEAVDRTRVVFSIDVHRGAADHAVAEGIEDLVRFWSTTNAEDRSICEAQQRGLAAAPRGYPAGPRATSEDGLAAFEAIVARGYLALGSGLALGGGTRA